MTNHDEVAGYNDAQLINRLNKLKNRYEVLKGIERSGGLNAKFIAEMRDIEAERERIDARISQRMQEGTVAV